MSAPRRRRHDPNVMAATEKSIWDVYNNVADLEDDELIKDWNDSLNFLLVFAAIFAAVLTALIVESMKLLAENPQDQTNNILLHISAQLANSTLPPFSGEIFTAGRPAIIINSLLFASLCCSLVAALAAVLALQWVNEYDARIDTVDARKRALIRHFRFLGVGQWKMGEIIAVLPLLLHASVFLFFAGIIEWLHELHHIIFYICLAGVVVAMAFYSTTVILASIFSNSPFRSPMARFSRYMIYGSVSTSVNIISSAMHWLGMISVLDNFRNFVQPTGTARSISTFQHGMSTWIHRRLVQTLPKLWIRTNIKLLEERKAKDKFLERSTMEWTIRRVELANQSTHRLVQILKHAAPLFGDKERQEVVNQVADTYLDKVTSQELLAEDDIAAIRILVKNWTSKCFQDQRSSLTTMVNKRGWEDWSPTLQLIGPLWISGSVTEHQLSTFVSIIEARCSRNSKTAVQQLLDATRHVVHRNTRQERQITSYYIDSLSIYLWDRQAHETSRLVIARLAEMLAIPVGHLHDPIKHEVSIPLALSALYTVAFGSTPGVVRNYWASAHPLYHNANESPTLNLVQDLHSAITSRIAAEAAQDIPPGLVEQNIQHLCRLLAYTPCNSESEANTRKRIEILEHTPHIFTADHFSTRENSLTALCSMIWLSKAHTIPRIHEYLEIFLSCRRRFPSLKPVWRSWANRKENQWPTWHSSYQYQRWMDGFRNDRRLVQLLRTFDGLRAKGCTTAEHMVMVQLAVDDLQDDGNGAYEGYYNEDRKASLCRLQDPALRLIGARAAKIAYSGAIPSIKDAEWKQLPWIEAVKFWCERYGSGDAAADEAVLYPALVQPNSALHLVVEKSSSHNPLLQGQLRRLLKSKLSRQEKIDDILLAHSSVRNASWFPEYLKEGAVFQMILKILPTERPLDLRVVLLLSDLTPHIRTPADLDVILTNVRQTLSHATSRPSQSDVDEGSTIFECLLTSPPQWIQQVKLTDAEWWSRTSENLNEIIHLLREEENLARATIRWTGPLSSKALAQRLYAELEEANAHGATTIEESDSHASDTIKWSYKKHTDVLGAFVRRIFSRKKNEQQEEESSSDETEEEEEDEEDEEETQENEGSSDEEDEEVLEEFSHKFKEGKGGGAGFFSCSSAFDI